MITDILKKMLQSVYSIRKRALFTGALVPLKAHVRVFVLLRRSNRYPKRLKACPRKSRTTTKKLVPSEEELSAVTLPASK